jgi:hypothetical protein
MTALEKLIDYAQEGDDPWIRGAFNHYLENNGMVHLEKCFGIDGRKLKYARRDYYLHRAVRSLAPDATTPSKQARLLLAELKRFYRRIWPATKDQRIPPENVSETTRWLFCAHKCGLEVPTTDRQLYDIMKKLEVPIS